MLNKVGSLTKIAAATTETPADLRIEQIIEPKKSNFVYFRSRSISAGDQGPKDIKWNYNGNLDFFSKKELLKAYKSFVGRNLFLNHDTSSPLKAVGRVVDAYPVEDPSTGEFYIETLARIDKELHPELASMVVNGDLNSVSMGASCGASMCSICGATIHSDQDQKCAHFSRLGQKFEAELDMPEYSIIKGQEVPAFAINSDLTFSELSIVSVPADSSALIKTVIASFRNQLNKIAVQDSGEYQSLNSEIQALSRLLIKDAAIVNPSEDLQATLFRALDRIKHEHPDVYQLIEEAFRDEVNKTKAVSTAEQPTAKVPSPAGLAKRAFQAKDLVEVNNHPDWAAGEVVEVKDDQVLVSWGDKKSWIPEYELELVEEASNPGLSKKGSDDWIHDLDASLVREAFKENNPSQLSLEESIEEQLSQGLKLNDIAAAAAVKVGAIDTEIMVQKPDITKPYKLALDEVQDVIYSIGEKVQNDMKDKPNLDANKKEVPEINTILQKLSGLDYERLQEHIAHKIKSRDNSMENLKAEVAPEVSKVAEVPTNLKPHEEGLPEAKSEMAEAKEEALEKAHEAKEVKEEKDEIAKLDEASKLIKEVKQEIKQELKDNEAEEAKLEKPANEPKNEAPEEEAPMDLGMPKKAAALTAKFNKKPFLSQSSWEVLAGDRVILKATLREICGEHLPKLRSFVASEQYGKNLIARIEQDGLEAVAKVLNLKAEELRAHEPIKTSYEAGEHLVATKEAVVEKKAGACPCGKEACTCDCMLGKECTCKMSMAKAAGQDSPSTLAQAEKPQTEPEGAKSGMPWDKNANAFASDKVPSDEAKKKEVGAELPEGKAKNSSDSVKTEYSLGKEAKLEKGEQTLSEAEKAAAFPAGGTRGDLMAPLSDAAQAKDIGSEGAAPKLKNSSDSVKTNEVKASQEPEVTVEAKLEPGEQKLSETEKVKEDFHPKMGTESAQPSEKEKTEQVGREAALNQEVAVFNDRVRQLEADLAKKATELHQEKMERALEAKMQKCRKLVEEMVRRDVLAENQNLVEDYVKQGQNLLDARKSALKDTIDLQLASFMQMPESLLKVQAETIARIKKSAGPSSDKLRIPVQGQFTLEGSETDWMSNLPWS